jgi:opacity protein-like surface antigen
VASPFEYFDRTGKAEFYGIGQYLHSDDITFHGPFNDVKMKMSDTGLGGFGMAYHFNQFISLRGDFMFGNADFSGDLPLDTGGTIHIKQDAFIQTGRLNVDYNIINRRITPFLTAGIGYQYLETELHRAPYYSYCYWDPWWGYICTTDHPSAWETDFTWNVGGGLRWNITEGLFIKAMVGANWIEYDNTSGITTQIEGIFAIGWMF